MSQRGGERSDLKIPSWFKHGRASSNKQTNTGPKDKRREARVCGQFQVNAPLCPCVCVGWAGVTRFHFWEKEFRGGGARKVGERRQDAGKGRQKGQRLLGLVVLFCRLPLPSSFSLSSPKTCHWRLYNQRPALAAGGGPSVVPWSVDDATSFLVSFHGLSCPFQFALIFLKFGFAASLARFLLCLFMVLLSRRIHYLHLFIRFMYVSSYNVCIPPFVFPFLNLLSFFLGQNSAYILFELLSFWFLQAVLCPLHRKQLFVFYFEGNRQCLCQSAYHNFQEYRIRIFILNTLKKHA